MPSRSPRRSLQQILEAIERIQTLTAGMDQQSYQEAGTVKLAVERLLQIVTEAAHRLGREATAICPGVDWRDIREMGNALRHDYDELLDHVLWNTIIADLPPLKMHVTAALKTLNAQDDER